MHRKLVEQELPDSQDAMGKNTRVLENISVQIGGGDLSSEERDRLVAEVKSEVGCMFRLVC